MHPVQPKKSLGQHFLRDKNIAVKIVEALTFKDYSSVLEIGPGTGILSSNLKDLENRDIRYVEIDRNSIEYLKTNYPEIKGNIIESDILKLDFKSIFNCPYAIIGNLPYNISSQIFFKILDSRDMIPEVVCMIQKEVAERIVSPPGSKKYGILSVFLQAYYKTEYLFTVNPAVFIPPPKVFSSVIRLTRNNRAAAGADEEMFFRIVKTSFNQRRKTIKNSLKGLLLNKIINDPIMLKRPEQLGVDDFIRLVEMFAEPENNSN